jgi:cytochrome b involved in lipid metabolism
MAPQSELRQRQGFISREQSDVATHSKKSFTWQDVAKNNHVGSAWMIVRNKVYDVTAWVDTHPGGREMILLHAGRECTNTFDSYHPFSNKAESVLKKFEIGTLSGPTEFPVFKPDSGFYRECCKRVGAFFQEKKIDPKNGFAGLWRMVLVFATAAVSYYGMHLVDHFPLQFAASVLFGMCQALPLLHVMHDCSHTSFTSQPVVQYCVGRFAMDFFAGGSMISWLNQHIVGHHIYTNVAGADPDLPVNFKDDIRRIVERQVYNNATY